MEDKKPKFSLVYSTDKKPVTLNDTAYFIGFQDYETAYTAMIYLNTKKSARFFVEFIVRRC